LQELLVERLVGAHEEESFELKVPGQKTLVYFTQPICPVLIKNLPFSCLAAGQASSGNQRQRRLHGRPRSISKNPQVFDRQRARNPLKNEFGVARLPRLTS
jgi:hypothetical protein